MHKSMEILMARMDSHPDEFDITFQKNVGRWGFILKPLLERCEAMVRGEPTFYVAFLSDDEVREVFHKLMAVQGDACTQKIMNELLADERNDRVPLQKFGDGRGGIPYVPPPELDVIGSTSQRFGAVADALQDLADRGRLDDSSHKKFGTTR
jgi:hypothetical protein